MKSKEPFTHPHNERESTKPSPLPMQSYQNNAESGPADAYTETGLDTMLEDDEIDCLEHGFMQGYIAAL